MTDFRALGGGRLGCADIHASVDEHRVRIDYFGSLPFCGTPPDHGGGQARLAGSRRPNEHYGHVHSVARVSLSGGCALYIPRSLE